MHDRSCLGVADVTDADLAGMVGVLLGADAELLGSRAEEVAYDLPALTTAGRYWVDGTAVVAGVETSFRIFVKHVQSWSRSPMFEMVPEEMRPWAEGTIPWRTEPRAYASDLRDHLPAGLTMPRCLGVYELDEKSSAVWLEAVPAATVTWDAHRFRRAAHLLGRLATTPALQQYGDLGEVGLSIEAFVEGRVKNSILPALHSDVWDHPSLAAGFGTELRDRLLGAADRVDLLADELAHLPWAIAHGDACPNNLLVLEAAPKDFTLIDFGFWGRSPIGFDLGQLLVGDVQIGRRDAGDLAALDESITQAYQSGLWAEECWIPDEVVVRSHALHLLLFAGFGAPMMDQLDGPPTAELNRLATNRAAIARVALDLVEATEQRPRRAPATIS